MRPSAVNRALILGVVMGGTTMALLDIVVVNVALPNIMVALGANVLEVRWVVMAFMLVSAVVMPLTGWLGRRIGLGPLFIGALIFFTVGTALCAASWSLNSLIAARIIQAIGAGALNPAGMALLTQTFPPHQRGRAIGIWGISLTIGPALGPTTGGYLIEIFDWRAAFMLNIPIGIASILFSLAILSRERDETAPIFDWSGYLALALFLTAALLTLDKGNQDGWHGGIILFGLGVTAFAFLLWLALEWDYPHALVPLRLFRIPDFSLAWSISMIRSVGMFGSMFLSPIFLQQVQGRDPIDTGLILVPAALAFAVGMPIAGVITDRFGGRWPTVVGAILAAFSFTLYKDIDFLSSRWDFIYPMLLRGVGMSLIVSPATTVGLNAVPREDVGTAVWLLNLGQRFGGAVVVAMLANLLYRGTFSELDRLGAAEVLRQAPSPDLLLRAAELGYPAAQVEAVARALYGWSVKQAANTIAYQNLFIMVALGLFSIVLPALFFSRGRHRGEVAS